MTKTKNMILEFIAAISVATLVLTISNHLKLNKIMASNAEMLALLEEADLATNEIAEDIQDLIDNGQVSGEVASKLGGHVEKLKGVASTHTKPTPPPPPPVE